MSEKYQRYFRHHIWERGVDLFHEGAVFNLERTGNTYTANVSGNYDDYFIEIEMDAKNKISYMSCTCPYAAKGYNCKHMAAVLLEIEHNSPQSDSQQATWQQVFKKYVTDHHVHYLYERKFRNELSIIITLLQADKDAPKNLQTALDILQECMQLVANESTLHSLCAELMTFFHMLITSHPDLRETLSNQFFQLFLLYPQSNILVYLLQFLDDHHLYQENQTSQLLEKFHIAENEKAVEYLLMYKIKEDALPLEQLAQYAKYESLQPLLAKKYLEKQDYEHAVPLLQKLSKSTSLPYSMKNQYFNQLNDIYLKTKNIKEYKKTLQFAIQHSSKEEIYHIIDNYAQMLDEENLAKEMDSLRNIILRNRSVKEALDIFGYINDAPAIFSILFQTNDLQTILHYAQLLYNDNKEDYLILAINCIFDRVHPYYFPKTKESLILLFHLFDVAENRQEMILNVLCKLREKPYDEIEQLQELIDEAEGEILYGNS